MNSSDEQQRTLCDQDQAVLLLTKDNVTSYMYSQEDTVVICIIMPVILTIGLLGNGAFLIVIARVPWMRKVTSNLYLACLAVVDITLIAVAIGVRLTRFLASPILTDDTVLGVPGCVTLYFISDLCFFLSQFLITLISFERYNAVCRPFTFRSKSGGGRRTRVPARRVAGCFLVGAAAASLIIPDRMIWKETCISWYPPGSGDDSDDLPTSIGQCSSVVTWYFNFSNCIQTVPFFLTMIMNLTLYVLTARKLYIEAKRRGPFSANTEEQNRIRDQITRMLIFNGTAFFIFLAPFESIALALTIRDLSGAPPALTANQFSLALNICRCLVYVNSAINPFIYTLTSPAYRRAFLEAAGIVKKQEFASHSHQDRDGLNLSDQARSLDQDLNVH
ncbi:thyrotropin-releasing hormone receptor-like [Asterias amurensis]|uniref:thyrotropin-releasing hormone receptor-like n=1 Tax=Asterias amurensis TaxID=7602 RepID=UPI003AB8DC90